MTEAAHDESGLDDLDPSALLDALADADRKVREGEREKLRIAHQWAVVHPASEDTGVATWGGDILLIPALLSDESLGGDGCPKVAAYAPEPLAITLGVSPTTAMQLIADALDLHHRLPRPGRWSSRWRCRRGRAARSPAPPTPCPATPPAGSTSRSPRGCSAAEPGSSTP